MWPLPGGGGVWLLPVGGGGVSLAGGGAGVDSQTSERSRGCVGVASCNQTSLPSVRVALRRPSANGLPSTPQYLVVVLTVYSSTRESSPTPTRTARMPLPGSVRTNLP